MTCKVRTLHWGSFGTHCIEFQKSNLFQYLVYSPLAFNIAAMCLCIFSIKPMQTSVGILSHSIWMRSQSSCMLSGSVSYLASCFLRCCHRCSIGLRSRDCAGYYRTLIELLRNHLVAMQEMCLGLLSCWKMILSRLNL